MNLFASQAELAKKYIFGARKSKVCLVHLVDLFVSYELYITIYIYIHLYTYT